MKSYKKSGFAFKRPPNIVFMLLAVIAAVIMWVSVNKWNQMEAQLEVGLDYAGIPDKLTVIDGLETKLMVRLRGPERLIRNIPPDLLRRTISLADIKPGKNIIPLGHDELSPLYRVFDVIDIQPPRIELTADRVIERSVLVKYRVESPLTDNALTVDKVGIKPSPIILKGPESKLNEVAELEIAIRPDPKVVGKEVMTEIMLDTPNFVTAIPPSVKVNYTVTSGREEIEVKCPISVAGDSGELYEVNPPFIQFRVGVPEALQNDAEYLAQLKGTVAPPDLEPGASKKMRPYIFWPEGMDHLSEIPEVVVTRKIREPGNSPVEEPENPPKDSTAGNEDLAFLKPLLEWLKSI